jgi:hypothetical protein
LQEGEREGKLTSEWTKLTNKERKRYRVEAEVKARKEAERRQELDLA